MKPIYVTSPLLPPISELLPLLEDIWESKILTNNGQYHQTFERELADFLGVPFLSLFSNGTLALMTALQALEIIGEVITTPYSFVATSHALHWNNIKPVFVDIEENFCNINPKAIEAAITPITSAILPVHVYGNPCDIMEIDRIAKKYNLKVIYDAAHAFGVKKNNSSILNFGDLSILSFHATKVFNTIEGGAIVCHDEKTKIKIDYLKNFGFEDEITVVAPGINAKMNELQAAYGLIQLKYVENAISRRKQIAQIYQHELANTVGIQYITAPDEVISNYSYFPVFINPNEFGLSRDEVYEKLKESLIFCRRYFYPLISNFPMYSSLVSSDPHNLSIATQKANNVLCLPIYPDLSDEQTLFISSKLNDLKK